MSIEEKTINSMRKLGLEQIIQANSGHTGIVLGASPLLYAVYSQAVFASEKPKWANRDRIVLSCGHGSALLYATLHLFGFDISIDDLKNFRQLGSKTCGHPEVSTNGVDVSTGALGQGVANAVGFALAEAFLSEKYNTQAFSVIDHYTYLICGDGDMYEGISYEAFSFAGVQKLHKLIALYDFNQVTLDNPRDVASSEDVEMRMHSAGWDTIVVDGNNVPEIIFAITKAKASNDKPTMIICKTNLGKDSLLENTPKAHGLAVSVDEAKNLITKYGLSKEPFIIDEEVYAHCRQLAQRGNEQEKKWKLMLNQYAIQEEKKYKELSTQIDINAEKVLDKISFSGEISTREASGIILNQIATVEPNLIVGSADVASSTKTFINGVENCSAKNHSTANIAFGVREQAMSGIANAIALHSNIYPIVSTFFVFSDYMRYGIRMSAIMNLPMIYVFTHDSFAVGEDGTTHQPIEQLSSLRLIPNLIVFRPADAYECVAGYKLAFNKRAPTVLVCSRQKLPVLGKMGKDDAMKGGYIIADEHDKKELHGIFIATGSEVELCLEAQKILQKTGYSIRVVSMPCKELFEQQDLKYRNAILPTSFPAKIVVEAGSSGLWYNIAGDKGVVLGIDHFGESGKYVELSKKYGFTILNLVNTMMANIKKNRTKVVSFI